MFLYGLLQILQIEPDNKNPKLAFGEEPLCTEHHTQKTGANRNTLWALADCGQEPRSSFQTPGNKERKKGLRVGVGKGGGGVPLLDYAGREEKRERS